MKKVLLVVIDALASRVVRPALEAGRLPHLAALAEAGRVDWNSTAIFPSITPAATAALVTGSYPCDSGICGAYFYDRDADRVNYYGDDLAAIMRRGFATFFQDFLVRLNEEQLRAETAFQTVEQAGLTSACLNYLWFHGEVPHRVRVPWLLRLWPGIPYSRTIKGPARLSLGDFVSDPVREGGPRLKGPGGLFRRFGFTDAATAAQLLILARERAWADLTVAYFPDNDYASHDEGPQAALETVEKVDRVLGQVCDVYGGLESLLVSVAVIVTGDHAQADMPHEEAASGIRLDELLHDYSIVPTGDDWGSDDQLMICPNMRAAQIYLRNGYWVNRQQLITTLAEEPRIDQVMWRDTAATGETWYCVQTQQRGTLRFRVCTTGSPTAHDEYGNSWQYTGQLSAVDAEVADGGLLRYRDYPNALERIATVFDRDVSGDIWVTSQPGFEFRLIDTSVHDGGSHGSLHALDSLSPLFMAGIPPELLPTVTPRSVDVAPLCLAILGLHGSRRVGQGDYAGSSPY